MTDYQALCDSYLQLLALDPNSCVELGMTVQLDQLPDPSLEAISRKRSIAIDLQQRAEAAVPTLTDFHERLDAQLIALAARRIALECGLSFNGRLQLQQLPRAGEEISSGVFLLVSNDPRPPSQRLDDILGRLQQVPEFLENMLARLEEPVARWVDIELETIDGLADFFATIQQWSEENSWPRTAELADAVAAANEALGAYCEQLRRLPTTTVFSIGETQARELVAANGLELSLEAIHQVARNFVQKTQSDIEELRKRLASKHGLPATTTASELQDFLADKYAVKVSDGDFDQVIQRYREVAADLEVFIAREQLFPVPQGQEMKIMQTPDFMSPLIPAGAMMPPPAMREGTRVSLVYLTLSEELLAEHTELGIPLMMVHEGIPGHHLQLATAAMHSSVVRRSFAANEHAEGWTTMLEDYMLDRGLMAELTDEARFSTKLDISRIGARVGIDLYFMTGNAAYLDIGYDLEFEDTDPFANAARLLIAATGFTPGRAQAELNWYSQERGYPLSYLVGNHLVWQLKQDYQAVRGNQACATEVDRDFHRIYLESGNMPVAMLRKVFEHELQQPLPSQSA